MKKQIVKSVLTIFFILTLSGCGEMVEGAGHMAYGFATFMLGLMKFIGIILLILVVGFIIISIIRAIFK